MARVGIESSSPQTRNTPVRCEALVDGEFLVSQTFTLRACVAQLSATTSRARSADITWLTRSLESESFPSR